MTRGDELRHILPYVDYVPYIFWPVLVWPVVVLLGACYIFMPPKVWRESSND